MLFRSMIIFRCIIICRIVQLDFSRRRGNRSIVLSPSGGRIVMAGVIVSIEVAADLLYVFQKISFIGIVAGRFHLP